MAKIDGLPINFTISDRAISAIEEMRHRHNTQFAENADVLAIGWGRELTRTGNPREGIAIGFYTRSERNSILHAIEIVRGMEVIFGVTTDDYWRFERKLLDFSPDKHFFLV